MESTYHSFEDLWIWQEAMEICYLVYEYMKDCRDYGLRNQMQDSAVSVPSNISEGFELQSNRAFVRHLYIAKGSAGELRTQMYVALNQNYIPDDKGKALITRLKILGAAIQRFIAIRKKVNRRHPL